MSEKGEKRATGRVFFDTLCGMRDKYIGFDLMNRAVAADGWTPDTSMVGELAGPGSPFIAARSNNAAQQQLTDGWWAQAAAQTRANKMAQEDIDGR